jgi:hypothetical protein
MDRRRREPCGGVPNAILVFQPSIDAETAKLRTTRCISSESGENSDRMETTESPRATHDPKIAGPNPAYATRHPPEAVRLPGGVIFS